MSTNQPHREPHKIEARIIDRPELMETFSDVIGPLSFDGNTLRIDFLVARMAPGAPAQSPVVHAFPACRLVLTPKAATELVNRLRSLAGEIQKQTGKPAEFKGQSQAKA